MLVKIFAKKKKESLIFKLIFPRNYSFLFQEEEIKLVKPLKNIKYVLPPASIWNRKIMKNTLEQCQFLLLFSSLTAKMILTVETLSMLPRRWQRNRSYMSERRNCICECFHDRHSRSVTVFLLKCEHKSHRSLSNFSKWIEFHYSLSTYALHCQWSILLIRLSHILMRRP